MYKRSFYEFYPNPKNRLRIQLLNIYYQKNFHFKLLYRIFLSTLYGNFSKFILIFKIFNVFIKNRFI